MDSIQIQNSAIHYSSQTGTIGYYRFKYIDKDSLPESYLTTAIDHWGYYNGKPYSIPAEGKFSSFKTSRDPNFTYAKCGSLSEIQYPTGGVSSFEYEENTYSFYQSDDRQSVVAENGFGGGLRIKSITEYDSPSHNTMLKKRTFEYDTPGTNTSSGELFATPKYYWPIWSAWCIDNNAKHEVETFRTSTIFEEIGKKPIVPAHEVIQYPSGQKDTLVTYGNYTSTGRPQTIKELGKPQMYLRWGFHDNYLMMKGMSYIPLSFTDKEVFDETKCLEKERAYIRSYGNIMGYVYHPFLGVVDIISPNGYVKKYSYDSIGRLNKVYDLDGKLLETMDYNYRLK